ncbi:MAG: DoxX family protein [Gemmatimonadales bacterium]
MTATSLTLPSTRWASLARKLLGTRDDATLTLARLALGAVMLPHGAQKVLGWFGGYGFSGTMGFFTQQMQIPALFAFLAITAEFAGSLALLAGAFTRVAALGILANMVVAVATTHLPIGFFMNWFGQYPAGHEGFEYHILAAGLAIVLILGGGGAFSADRAITKD